MTVDERFADLDATIAALDLRVASIARLVGLLGDHVDTGLAEMDERLVRIRDQNLVLAEMIEVLGGYVNTSIEHTQHHTADPHAHG